MKKYSLIFCLALIVPSVLFAGNKTDSISIQSRIVSHEADMLMHTTLVPLQDFTPIIDSLQDAYIAVRSTGNSIEQALADSMLDKARLLDLTLTLMRQVDTLDRLSARYRPGDRLSRSALYESRKLVLDLVTLLQMHS